MVKPEKYSLKKWLTENIVVGLRVYYYQTGTDTSDTDWELTPAEGAKKRMKSHSVIDLVDLRPDWVRVLQVKSFVIKEVDDYKKFEKKEKKDLAEFERLKAKFT